jgi:hypothetical protein
MCHLTETQLNEYLDQLLEGPSRQDVEAHLEACNQCQGRLAELEKVFSTLENLPDEPLTHDLLPSVMARLPKVMEPSLLWREPVFIAQSLLAIILLILSIPILPGLIRRITAWDMIVSLPQIQLLPLFESYMELIPRFTWHPQITSFLPDISLSIPKLPFKLEANTILVAAILAGLLWVIGNFSLLRTRSGVKK